MKKTNVLSVLFSILLLVGNIATAQERMVEIIKGGEVIYSVPSAEIDYMTVAYRIPAPTGVQGTVSDQGIKITWQAVSGATQYKVYRSADGKNFTLIGTATTNSYTDRNPLSGDNYYRVQAIGANNSKSDFAQAPTSYRFIDLESGLYLGIIGFNQRLSTYPIQLLNKSSKPGFDCFINSLNNDNNGTPVYYAVANGISALNSMSYPEDIINASIITFTDGIDNYSLEQVDGYNKADDYGDAVHQRITTEKVAGLDIDAYAIGLKSAGVNAETFTATLGRIASADSLVFEADDMEAVENKFIEIARKIYESSNQVDLTVSIPGGLDDGTPIRFTFDVSKQGVMTSDKADKSTVFIEGVYKRIDRQNRYIQNVNCSEGLKINNKEGIRGVYNSATGLVDFTFEGLDLGNNRQLDQKNIWEWWGSPWQFDDEFESGENTKLLETKRTAAIVLVLDCTKSLGETLFKDMQASAKSFVNVLLQNSLSDAEKVYPTSVSLNKTSWRARSGETVSLSATVYPSDATDKSVTYSSSNPSVATVNASGVVTAVAEGTATITVRTNNGKSATCAVTVSNFGNQTITVNGVSFDMIAVEGGTFTMGATSEQGSDASSSEKPTHSVTLSDYYIGKTEVTQALWKAVMGSNPSNWSGDNLPVEQVSWNDIQTFITKLNQLTGKTFALPTEAQWEYAARGGNKSKGYKYSGSNSIGDVAWYTSNSSSKTHAVGTKAPNELGIYDMSGNVWEWCSDWYGNYSSSAQTNPTGPSSGSNRVLRGGGWYDSASGCRVSLRDDLTPSGRSSNLGFRVVLLP